MTDPLVSVEWLEQNLEQVIVLDTTYYLPADPDRSRNDYLLEHIPGAQLFEIDSLADKASNLPHMLPTEKDFSVAMANLGIDGSRPVVVYDRSGNHFSAPRVWFMLRLFGLQNSFVLNGGLAEWKRIGCKLSSGSEVAAPVEMQQWKLSAADVLSGKQIAQCIAAGGRTILDARAQNRFDGQAPEPRPGLSSGHMPGATCVPFTGLTDASGKFATVDRLREIFESVEDDAPIVSCGSGMTACVLALGLARIGIQARLYDGSWAEWGTGTLGPIQTTL